MNSKFVGPDTTTNLVKAREFAGQIFYCCLLLVFDVHDEQRMTFQDSNDNKEVQMDRSDKNKAE